MLKRQLRPAQDFIENVHKCVEVQGLGPWRGLGQRPNLACFIGQWFGRGVCSAHNTNPAKRVRAWAQSRHSSGQPEKVWNPPIPVVVGTDKHGGVR